MLSEKKNKWIKYQYSLECTLPERKIKLEENVGQVVHTFVWKSSTPASKNSSLSDCKVFAVSAAMGVLTPIDLSCLVA